MMKMVNCGRRIIMLAVIRVLTTDDQEMLLRHGRLIEEKYNIACSSYCIPDQFQGIYDDATERMAIPKIVQVAKQAVKDGAQAIFISCAADPAVEEVRRCVNVPVIGAGTALAAVGIALSSRIGVLNLTEETPPGITMLLGKRMVAEAKPAGVKNTTELLANRSAAVFAARSLMAAGAEIILLACTGYSTIGMAETIRQETGCMAVDAVLAGGLIASHILKKGKGVA